MRPPATLNLSTSPPTAAGIPWFGVVLPTRCVYSVGMAGTETPAATDEAFTSDRPILAAASEFTSQTASEPLDQDREAARTGIDPRRDFVLSPLAPAGG
jgi:hypothetical protein